MFYLGFVAASCGLLFGEDPAPEKAAPVTSIVADRGPSKPPKPIFPGKAIKSGSATKPVVADFAKAGKRAIASSGALTATVEDAALRVAAGASYVKFAYTEIGWGVAKPKKLGKVEPAIEGKKATTSRGDGLSEKVSASTRGFENDLVIPAMGGPGDLRVRGLVETNLTLEETFLREHGASSFTTTSGLVFMGPTKQRLLRVARTVIFDSAGKKLVCPVNYTESEGGLEFEVVVPAAWLLTAIYPVTVDPLIGSASDMGFDPDEDDMPTGVAYGDEKFFLVGVVEGTGEEVYGQILNADGTSAVSPFLISSIDLSAMRPRVAYVSGDGGVFGVVYASGSHVYLRRYESSGTLIGSAIQIDTDSNAASALTGDIASDGDGSFLVVWGGENSSDVYQIWGEVRDSAGDIVTGDTVLASASGSVDLGAPAAAWNGTAAEWFIAYESVEAGTPPVRIVRGTSWDYDITTQEVTPFTIGSGSGQDHFEPACAWNSVADEYLVSWSRQTDDDPVTMDVRARRVTAASGALAGDEIECESGTGNSRRSTLAFCPPDATYLLTYCLLSGPSGDEIIGQMIHGEGTLWQDPFTIGTDGIASPAAMGYNGDDDQLLVAWYEAPALDRDTWVIRADVTSPGTPTLEDLPSGPLGDTVVEVEWGAVTAGDLAGYHVYYRVLGETEWTAATGSPVTVTVYPVTGLTNGLTYEFTVASIDSHDVESRKADPEEGMAGDSIPPAVPTGLQATPGYELVDLIWTPNSESDLAGYNVYRSTTSGGTYTKINAEIVTTYLYSDTDVTNLTKYWYKITAVDESTNESAKSTAVSATPTYPNPTWLTFNSSTYNSITFSWTGISESDLGGYNVYRAATSGGAYAKLNSSPVETTSYTDSGLPSGSYFYVVTSVSTATEESVHSNELAAQTEAVPPPTWNTSASRKTNDTTPVVSGTSTEGWIIRVYEGATLLGETTAGAGGAFSLSIPATGTLVEGTHILIAKATIDVDGDPTSGPNSGAVLAVDATAPATPVGLKVLLGDGFVDVRWTPNLETDLLGYNIYRRPEGSGDWTKLNNYPLLHARYVDRDVTNYDDYEYRVVAVDNSVDED